MIRERRVSENADSGLVYSYPFCEEPKCGIVYQDGLFCPECRGTASESHEQRKGSRTSDDA